MPNAEDYVEWVNEGGNLRAGGGPGMKRHAYDYQSGTPGARSSAITGYGQAPRLSFIDEDTGLEVAAKFDGVRRNQLIDRKTNPAFSAKAVNEAQRQVEVASHYGLQVVWQLPTESAVAAANRFMTVNNITEITVELAHP